MQTYFQAKTLIEAQSALFEQILTPYLKSFKIELPDFVEHLRCHLVPRLLVHLNHFVKQRAPAWREFNRLLLEQLQAQVQMVANNQQKMGEELTKIIKRLDMILAEDNDSPAFAEWADKLADLLAAVGRIEQQIDEKIDALLMRVVEQNRDVVERLESLTVAIGEVREGVERTEFKVTQVGVDVTVVRELVEKMVGLLQAGRGWQPVASSANIVVAERARLVQVPLITRLESFFEYYTPLFAGREKKLTTIGSFLQEQPSGYIFVTGLSGYGKTTLLVNLIHRDRGRYLYYFFNRQRGTSKYSDFLRTMCQQLLAYYQIEGQLPLDVTELEALYAELVRLPLVQSNQPLVLVIDGLDEADGFIRGLHIPRQLSADKFIIFSARETGRDYIDELGLPSDQVLTINLEQLDEAGVEAVLRTAGATSWADDTTLVGEVLRVSKGDPFYLHELVQDMAKGQITSEQIADQPAGLTAYLDGWWQQVVPVMRRDQDLRNLMGLLMVALGPLPSPDLFCLDSELEWGFDDILKPVRRFIIIEQSHGIDTYTLCHPRFRAYLANHKLRGKAQTYRSRLLTYCAQWKKNNNRYALQHYAAHLAEAEQWDKLHSLVATGNKCIEWSKAHHTAEGSYAGYFEDLQLAWAHADEIGMTNPATAIGYQVRYALIKSSIHNLTANIPPELLVALVEKKVWTAEQGFAHTRLMQNEGQRGEALARLAPHLPADLRLDLFHAAQAIQNEEIQAITQATIVPYLPQERLREVLETVQRLKPSQGKVAILAMTYLASHLPEIGQQVSKDIFSTEGKVLYWTSLLSHLPVIPLREVFEVTQSIESGDKRAEVLANLVPLLPDKHEAFKVARAIEDDYYRVKALVSLAARGPDQLLAEALEVARAIEHDHDSSQAKALAILAARLPDQLLDEALEVARAIGDDLYRAKALASLAAHWPDQLLAEAFEVARAIEHDRYRAQALAFLVEHWPDQLLAEALEVARAIEDDSYRAQALVSLAIRNPDQLLAEALEVARAIEDDYQRAKALASLSARFPDQLLGKALEVAHAIEDDLYRTQALASLAIRFPDQLFAEALEAARAIDGRFFRGQVLTTLAPQLAVLPLATLYPLWRETLPILAERTRKQLLADVVRLMPMIEALGNQQVVKELVQAVQDVGRWWP